MKAAAPMAVDITDATILDHRLPAQVRVRGCGRRRHLLCAAVEQVAVSGSGRRGTSRRGLKRNLAISDGIGGEAQGGRNVVEFQWRKLSDDLVGCHAISDHPDNRGHGNAQPADARHATHLSRVDSDAIHQTVVPVCSLAISRFSSAAAMVDRYTEWADWTDQADE